MSESELVQAETQKELAVAPVNNPDSLIALGIEKGASVEQMKDLYAFKRQWEADEAKKAYMQAVAAFKANPPKIYKDKVNNQYGSMYTSIEGLVNSAVPALSDHGLSHRWNLKQDNGLITVECILSHALGHSESVSMSGPPDDSGKKNPIQRIKSTQTYLKGATFEAITGLASELFNLSDDGNGSSIDYVDAEQIASLECLITEVGTTKEAFCKVCKVSKLEELPASKYDGAIRRLEQKRKSHEGS